MAVSVRTDLVAAHRLSIAHAVAAGATLSAGRRRAIVDVVVASLFDPSPPPPWQPGYGDPLLDGARRLARHAGTLDERVYRRALADGVDPLQWVEMVGVVIATVAPVAFARAAGVQPPAVPAALPGPADPPTGALASDVVAAQLNWVPVAAPADQVASVVQALSAIPAEWDNLWRLAAAQYMSDRQMDDPAWTRGTLSRPQLELVAARVSSIRECFF
jgi:hypothetical protein